MGKQVPVFERSFSIFIRRSINTIGKSKAASSLTIWRIDSGRGFKIAHFDQIPNQFRHLVRASLTNRLLLPVLLPCPGDKVFDSLNLTEPLISDLTVPSCKFTPHRLSVK